MGSRICVGGYAVLSTTGFATGSATDLGPCPAPGVVTLGKRWNPTAFTTDLISLWGRMEYGSFGSVLVRCGVWASGADGRPTGLPVLQTAQVAPSAGGVGPVHLAVSPAATVPAGILWFGGAANVVPAGGRRFVCTSGNGDVELADMGLTASWDRVNGFDAPWAYQAPPVSMPDLTGATFTTRTHGDYALHGNFFADSFGIATERYNVVSIP